LQYNFIRRKATTRGSHCSETSSTGTAAP